MGPELLFFLILCIVVLLGATVLVLIVYSGLFTDVEVRTGASPFRRLKIFYKFRTGAYKDSTELFIEAVNAGPGLRTIGIYYDNPEKVPPEELRSCVGCIVEEGGVPEAPDIQKLTESLQKHGFKALSLPPVPTVVLTSFPWTTNLSILMAMKKVYPQMQAFLKTKSGMKQERRLHAGPFVEIYEDGSRRPMLPKRRNSDADDNTDSDTFVSVDNAIPIANTEQSARILFWAPVPSSEDYFCPEAVQAAMDNFERRRAEKERAKQSAASEAQFDNSAALQDEDAAANQLLTDE